MFRLILLVLLFATPLRAQSIDSSQGPIRVEVMAEGLAVPWGFAFLPEGGVLVTERDGALVLLKDGKAARVSGVPEVVARGQGGLLDVMVPRDFATSREVFLSFSKRQGGALRAGAGTALGVGRLEGASLVDFRVIFEMKPGSSGGRHFGSRIVEAPDGRLFLTVGERGDRPAAQDLARHEGSVIRINRDGSVPGDNPFAGVEGAAPEIWSYGHRNPQGATLGPDGQLWVVEHGAQGGDEVNLVRRGANYGWPVIAYGRHYSGAKIGEGTRKEGMAQPAHYWDPSIAPSGMMIYSGKLWPAWRGHVFVGSLKFDYLSRLNPAGWAEERLASDDTLRVRDVREGPDGAIWILSVGNGTLLRLTPG
ncbi:PQQ-dependent sugar dehydrogenase [Aliiroseovarius sp.]|uniref:PQQ-dependent sugar dehydrogenase n=1 Tax=Aliiroseovarius sp. TaxID=1872442 RepID=UPI0026305B24|nr:PQQ-dependent sugar dehydrogenase [Aliiroseovarius sp.]